MVPRSAGAEGAGSRGVLGNDRRLGVNQLIVICGGINSCRKASRSASSPSVTKHFMFANSLRRVTVKKQKSCKFQRSS